MAVLAGCSPKSTPVALPAGATFEVYAIAAAKLPNTIPAVDPGTGGQLFLQTPPIVTTTDVATVVRSSTETETANGMRSEPAMTIELTSAGSAKMAAATATPSGQPIAVVLNGKVLCTPRMFSPIRNGTFQISGDSHVTAAIEFLTRP